MQALSIHSIWYAQSERNKTFSHVYIYSWAKLSGGNVNFYPTFHFRKAFPGKVKWWFLAFHNINFFHLLHLVPFFSQFRFLVSLSLSLDPSPLFIWKFSVPGLALLIFNGSVRESCVTSETLFCVFYFPSFISSPFPPIFFFLLKRA